MQALSIPCKVRLVGAVLVIQVIEDEVSNFGGAAVLREGHLCAYRRIHIIHVKSEGFCYILMIVTYKGDY